MDVIEEIKKAVEYVYTDSTPEWFAIQADKRFNKMTFDEVVKIKCRMREIVLARQLNYYFIHKYTNLSLKSIGLIFTCQDHSTVIHGRDTINDLCDSDKSVKSMVDNIMNHLRDIFEFQYGKIVGVRVESVNFPANYPQRGYLCC